MIKLKTNHNSRFSRISTRVLVAEKYKRGDMRRQVSQLARQSEFLQTSMYYSGYDTEFQLSFYNIRNLSYEYTLESMLTPVVRIR